MGGLPEGPGGLDTFTGFSHRSLGRQRSRGHVGHHGGQEPFWGGVADLAFTLYHKQNVFLKAEARRQ